MDGEITIRPIARIKNDYMEKFGVPRQSGLAEDVVSTVIFEPEFRMEDALRGIESFTHIWLIWGFSKANRKNWSPTVRPPRLGGNTRMGVFATRSPFRPNGLALSAVRLSEVKHTAEYGTVLEVMGADLMDGTPIYDIKPYLPYADSIPRAMGGYTDGLGALEVSVSIPEDIMDKIPEEKRAPLISVLSHDPRPTYQDDPERVYGMAFGGINVKFTVNAGVLTVCDAEGAGTQQNIKSR